MSIACLGCRARKVKCDGRKPRCFNCELYHDECTFVFHNDKRKPYPREYIDALNSRISLLEGLLKKAHIDFDADPNLPARPVTVDDMEHSVSPPGARMTLNGEPIAEEYMDRLTDRVGQLSMTPSGLRYFGPTSNLHLLSSIVWTRRPISNIEFKGRAAVEAAGYSHDIDHVKRNHLLNLYWTWHHPFFNITEKSLFLRDMEIYDNGMPEQAKYFSPLLLNAMLAAASLLDEVYKEGDEYLMRARILLDIEVEEPRITAVQAAAVLGACEAVCDRDTRGWIYSGMSIRMAVDLGYQLNCDVWVKRGVISAEEAHMRKITFWGCFVFDRLWSFYMGRPASLRLGDVFVARPDESDGRFEEKESWVPYSGPNDKLPSIWTEFTAPTYLNTTMIHLVKLCELIGEIQEVMYTGTEGIGPALWSFASGMHVKLASWYTNLPPPLFCSVNSQKPVLSHIVVLHMQYHATLIILHRPFLKYANSDANVIRARRICRTAAVDISNLVDKYQNSWYGMRRVNVIALHIIFTAATVHLLNIWNETGLIRDTAVRCLKICCKSLKEQQYETCKRTLAMIHTLATKGRYSLEGTTALAEQPEFQDAASPENLWNPEQLPDPRFQIDKNSYELMAAQQFPHNELPLPMQPPPPHHIQHHQQQQHVTALGNMPFNPNNFTPIQMSPLDQGLATSEWLSKSNGYSLSDSLNDGVRGYYESTQAPVQIPLTASTQQRHQPSHSAHSSLSPATIKGLEAKQRSEMPVEMMVMGPPPPTGAPSQGYQLFDDMTAPPPGDWAYIPPVKSEPGPENRQDPYH